MIFHTSNINPMSQNLIKKLGILALILCGVFATATAQKRVTTSTIKKADLKQRKGISSRDQAAIKAIFKDVDPSLYRLQFNHKREVMGTKKVAMRDVKQVKRITNPAEAAGWIVLIVEGDDVIYVLAVGSSRLVSALGRQKARQLNAIMAKYK